jgi:rod shape determining protein RodA
LPAIKSDLYEHPFRIIYDFLKIDAMLFMALVILSLSGLMVLYSASGGDIALVQRQCIRLLIGFVGLLVFAQIPVEQFRKWSFWLYLLGVVLLLLVLAVGDMSKGAQRWLDLGFIRFQPSELMKICLPMMVAWYFSGMSLPPSLKSITIAFVIVLFPVILIIRQPDLGTAILVTGTGLFVIFLAGISYRLIAVLMGLTMAAAPVFWNYLLHDYQRVRILTLLDPERDPLGAGYHIIQSKIAIGSGGVYGRGWFDGTQSHLDFVPERSTDFIFSVFSEEFGFIGASMLILLYLIIIVRGLIIAANAQSSYARLLGGAISLSFFSYVFVNIGMVSGLLPVVGVPLPLISYGGTSMVTLLAMFGVLMSIHSHKKLLGH